jgi:hypothetical protein
MATRFVSARHQAALDTPTGYRRRSRFTFSRSGATVQLEPTSARLTQDARRNARWDGQLSFAGNDLIPTGPGDILTPFGTRVDVELGLELLNGQVAYVPYGRYEISSSRGRITAGERFVDVSLIDISDRVERYRFETPFTVATGTDLATVINSVVTSRIGVNPGVGLTGTVLGGARTFGLDAATAPWSEILDVLANFSRVAWYDRSGQITLGNLVPDPASAYALGSLTSFAPDYDTRPPNVIVARGEAQDGTAPVQAVAMDTNPSSPTYAGTGPGTSPYGRRTEYFSSPLLLTVAQAQSAANTILAQNVGAGATYTLVRPYDPTITAGDVTSLGGAVLVVDAVTVNVTGDTELQVRQVV